MKNQTVGQDGDTNFGFLAKVKEWYQIIFVPYAILFIPYVAFGTLATFFAFYFGGDAEKIKFKWIPLGIGLGILALLALTLLRWNRNRLARKNSLNKKIKIIEERNGLHFRGSDFVDYCTSIVISPTDNETKQMVLFLEWHGDLKDVDVENEDGCKIEIVKAKENSGINVIAKFGRTIKKGGRYPFSFILRFDNHNDLICKYLKKVHPYIAERIIVQFLKFDSNAPTRFVESVYAGVYVKTAESEVHKVVQGGYHDFSVLRPRQGKCYKIAVAE